MTMPEPAAARWTGLAAGSLSPSGLVAGHLLLLVLLAGFLLRGGHDEQRILQVVFLGAAAVVLLAGRVPILPVGRLVAVALAGFFGLGALSSGLALSPRLAGYEVATLLLGLFVATAVGAEIAGQGSASALRLLRGAAVVAAVYALKVVAVYLSVFVVGAQPGAGDFTPGFNNYRFFNYAQTVLLPLLVAVHAVAAPRSAERRIWFLVCSVWVALVCVTAARGTALGLVAGVVAVAAVSGRQGRPFLRAAGMSAIGGAALFLVFFYLVPVLAGMQPFGEFNTVAARTISTPVSGRGPLWTLAAGLAADHPWLGVGPLHFAHESAVLQNAAHPHNWVLQVAAEWGLPALFLLCAAIGAAGLALHRCVRAAAASGAANQGVAAGLVAAGAALVVDGLVSGNIVMPLSQLAICLYLGVASGWCAAIRGTRPITPSPLHRVVLLLALAALVHGTWPEIGRRLDHAPMTAAEAQANGNQVACPRLWVHGFF